MRGYTLEVTAKGRQPFYRMGITSIWIDRSSGKRMLTGTFGHYHHADDADEDARYLKTIGFTKVRVIKSGQQ